MFTQHPTRLISKVGKRHTTHQKKKTLITKQAEEKNQHFSEDTQETCIEPQWDQVKPHSGDWPMSKILKTNIGMDVETERGTWVCTLLGMKIGTDFMDNGIENSGKINRKFHKI